MSRLLYLVVSVSGACILSLEILGTRVLGPFYGVSIYLWSALISITLAATNQYHEFMWYLPIANDAGEFLTRPERWGPWFLFIHAPYSYIVIGVAIMTLLAHSSAVARAHRDAY